MGTIEKIHKGGGGALRMHMNSMLLLFHYLNPSHTAAHKSKMKRVEEERFLIYI